MMRVTVGSASYAALNGLQTNAARLAALQAQLSSGKQITKPSDDPAGTIEALQLRGDLGRNTQFATNATDAISFMSTADATYSQMVTLAQKARTLVVQGLNSGTSTGTSDAAIADQVGSIRTEIINLANTTYNGQPVFGGTTSGGIAYNPDGTYAGDGGAVQRQVGPSTTVTINQIGPDIFGTHSADPTHPSATNTPDLFQVLSNVADALRGVVGAPPLAGNQSGTPPVPGALDQLDTAVQRLSTAQAREGAIYSQVQTAQSVQAAAGTTLKTELSGIQDIDLAEMAVKVSTAQVTYQAALQTTANVRQMSLLTFLN